MLQSKLLSDQQKVVHKFCLSRNEIRAVNSNSFYSLDQVHGKKVIRVPEEYTKNIQADGMIAHENLQLSIKTADCLPIFLYNKKQNTIGAVHAGWKGLYLGIINEIMIKMFEMNIYKDDILVAIGPHIGVCCYSVEFARVKNFYAMGMPKKIAFQKNGFWYLDLAKIAAIQLMQNGIIESHLEILPMCTSCDKKLRSVRREGQNCDRMYSTIILKV